MFFCIIVVAITESLPRPTSEPNQNKTGLVDGEIFLIDAIIIENDRNDSDITTTLEPHKLEVRAAGDYYDDLDYAADTNNEEISVRKEDGLSGFEDPYRDGDYFPTVI